jgi:hypothetical protein
VTEFLPEDTRLLDPDNITRRDVLRFGAGLAAIAAIEHAPWFMLRAAEVYDLAASPEDIITGPVPVLEPRTDNEPSVSPEECGEAFTLRATCSDQGLVLKLSLPSRALWAEHTEAPVNPSESFTSAGTAIITTAEGPQNGKQEYCTLFTGPDPDGQVLAIGFEGGLYTYERSLGHDKGTNGEWVRVLGQTEDAKLPSPAFVDLSVLGVDLSGGQPEHLVQKVVKGTETLHKLGYRPWAAVLPSTKMPDMITKDLTHENCAQNIEEVLDGKTSKNYFISKKGDLLDAHHMAGKAEQTLKLFADLFVQRAAGVEQPAVNISYGTGSNASFEFAVSRDSLRPENFTDTVYALMQTEGMIMEGISQRLALEQIPHPFYDMLPEFGGLGPEDLFSNSLAITGMLSLIQDHNMEKRLDAVIEAARRRNPQASAEDLQADVETAIRDITSKLAQRVVAETAHALGVRHQKLPLSVDLPRGIYALVPTKVSDKDAATPTRINTQAIGVRPNNPNAHFRPTNVPAMETAVERGLQELGY